MWQHSRFEKSTIVTQHRPPHHVRFSWHPCILLITATISKQSYLDSFELWEFLIRTTQKVFGFTPAHYSSNTFCFFHPLPLKSCVLSSAHTAFRSWNANIPSNLKSCSIKSPWTYRGRKSPRNKKDRAANLSLFRHSGNFSSKGKHSLEFYANCFETKA